MQCRATGEVEDHKRRESLQPIHIFQYRATRKDEEFRVDAPQCGREGVEVAKFSGFCRIHPPLDELRPPGVRFEKPVPVALCSPPQALPQPLARRILRNPRLFQLPDGAMSGVAVPSQRGESREKQQEDDAPPTPPQPHGCGSL